MEDLAHSLKTPLAVMRNELSSRSITSSSTSSTSSSGDDLVAEQLDRMETTVTYQLSRAAVSGPVVVGRAVPVGALVERLLRALNTAYRDRQIKVEHLVPADLSVRGDERDLLEMLGNLLENAFKYTRTRIAISADREGSEREGVMRLLIEDDGPGIEDSMRERVLNRGTRADEIQSGQGIGLAMVNELVIVYRGKLSIGVSRWGGAAIHLQLPLSASTVG